MASHNELGEKGEAIALDYLQKKGYAILARNYRFKRWEIDIVAEKDNLVVIVEVKTRHSRFMAGPEQTVTRAKQKSIVKTAHEFMVESERDNEVRFDIISILLNDYELDLEHLEDAFYPTL